MFGAVGYGRPPRHTQFKKGQSGNPAGRPKGSKNKMQIFGSKLTEDILNQAERLINVHDKEGTEKITVQDAIVRSIFLQAAQGKLGSQKLSVNLIEKAEQNRADRAQENVEFYIRLKAENKQKRKDALIADDKAKFDNILPLDEHLEIDPETCELKLTGPWNIEEKQLWDEIWATKRKAEAQIPKLISKLKKQRGDEKALKKIGAVNERLLEANIILHMRWHRPTEELFSSPFERQEFEEMVAEVLEAKLEFSK
jgi:hypothetical protein